MKHLFLISMISLSSMAYSADGWKVVAETTSCDEKIQILGKEGEKYVMAVKGDEKTKLASKDGASFHANALKSTEFTSKSGDVTFTQPSYVESNPPKIDVAFNGDKKRCKMELSR